MYYRIGLDIGIASVGWCALETDNKGEPIRIIDLGSRIFDTAEVPKTGASLAEPRRLARGLRRRLRRRTHRIDCAKNLFLNQNIDITPNGKDVNLLRLQALDERISEQDFARVLLMLIKRRGFKSNRRSENSKEDGLLLKATSENVKKMQEGGYRTIGEMFAKEYSYGINGNRVFNTRNKGGDYSRTVLRIELEKEIRLLFDCQKRFGNSFATEENLIKIIEIFNMQRNFDDGPGKGSPYSASYMVGFCQFEENEERAPKASYSFERSMALQKLNNLKIVSGSTNRFLSNDERSLVLALIDKQKKVTFGNIRKVLNLSQQELFNALTYTSKKQTDDLIKECEKKVFVSTEKSKSIMDCLSGVNQFNNELIDEIAVILSHAKTDSNRIKLIKENETLKNFTTKQIDNILSLNFDKFGNLSLKALRKILPYLEAGDNYSDACAKAGYNHCVKEYEKSKFLNTKQIYDEVSNITSPVVKRSISQTLKVVNALILKYGSPLAVNIELAREMNKSRDERNKIEKENNERFAKNKHLQDIIFQEYNYFAKGVDILKYKLYEEQCGKCMYSGQPIDATRLFEPNYVQVDHIIPYSKSFNDSFNNKVLVLSKENQNKGNKTPFEYLFNSDRWNDFVDRVNATYGSNFKKKQMLLKENVAEDDWKDRALNDTRYISRFIHGLIYDYLMFEKGDCGNKRVLAVNGAITSNLRHQWGINKVREDGDLHHAVDAAVIACVTNGAIKKLSDASRRKETEFVKNNAVLEPYSGFADELIVRCMEEKEDITSRLQSFGYTDEQIEKTEPVFVSRMPKRKGKGAIHAETIKSAKYKDEGIVVSKISIKKLKLNKTKDGYEIENYFRPEDDKLTYELLLNKLIEANGNAEKAFGEKVFKPCGNNKQPNEIKKVKVYENYNAGVFINKNKAFADNANGSMIRIDVFKKDGKYYCVPVYTADLYSGILPNLASVAGKKKSDWQPIDKTFDFQFALYPNDLIYIKHKKGISMSKQRDNANTKMPDTLEFTEGFVYYKGFGISVASAVVINHNNCYSANIGLKTLQDIKKCEVDVLGNVTFVKKETRPKLSLK